MYKVKLTVYPNYKGINRQAPKGSFVWGDYKFYINEEVEEADFWAVFCKDMDGGEETCLVAPENTMFFPTEPESVYHYARKFTDQFGKIVSCRSDIKHMNVVMDQPCLGWYCGRVGQHDSEVTYSRGYDEFKTDRPEKTKLISVISSNKCFTKGHRDRIAFVQKLKEHYGDKLEIFGKGFNGFDDKWDVVAPYKYHIALENSSEPYYWTEKLADSFLGNAFTFYYGCPNVGEYFSENAYRAIDIHDPEGAIRIIDEALAGDFAGRYAEDVETAKQQVLDEYNIFPMVIKHLQDMNPKAEKRQVTIKSDMKFFDLKKYFIVLGRVWSTLQYKLSK